MTPESFSPEVAAELAKLRDIRLPDPIGWWPLAPGWWGLLAIAVLALVAFAVHEFRRRRTVRYLALAEFAALRDRLAKDGDAHGVGVELAVLLRRIVLSTNTRAVLPGLADDAWANELASGDNGLSAESAAYLAQAPYAPKTPDSASKLLPSLFKESELWIRRHA